MLHRFKTNRLKKLMLAITACSFFLLCSCANTNIKPEDKKSNGSSYSSAKSSSRINSEKSSSQSNKNSSSMPIPKKHIICIDPGHQKLVDLSGEPIAPGSDVMKMKNPGGAMGVKSKTPEYVINLSVSLKIKTLLTQKGYTVIMTRDNDDSNISNIERAKVANDAQADIFLRIHADSVSEEDVKGASVLIPKAGYIKDTGLISESRTIGDYVLKGIVSSTGAVSRGLSPRSDMTGFNWSKVPVILVEMGFLSNPHEDELLNTEVYQEKIAQGIVNGIDEYFINQDNKN